MTELDAWLFGAAPVVLFVGGMWLTSWLEDRITLRPCMHVEEDDADRPAAH